MQPITAPQDGHKCQQRWLEVRANPDTESRENLYFDDELGLGKRLRFRALCELLRQVSDSTTKQSKAAEARETVATELLGLGKASARKYLALRQPTPLKADRFADLLELVSARASLTIEASGGWPGNRPQKLRPRLEHLLTRTEFYGERAYLDFFEALAALVDQCGRVDASLFPTEDAPVQFIDTPDRDRELATLRQLVHSEAPLYSPVIPVYASAMPSALTALAQLLIADFEHRSEHRSVLYLPASAYGRHHQTTDYATLLARLDAFLHPDLYSSMKQGWTLADVVPRHTQHDNRLALDRVRSTLLDQPIVLLIDGVDQAHSLEPELDAAVTGSPVLRLIKQLTFVDADKLCQLNDPRDNGLCRSRIVVFISSERELQEVGSITDCPPIHIGPPRGDSISELTQQYRNKALILPRIAKGVWNDDAFVLADVLVSLKAEAQSPPTPKLLFQYLKPIWAIAIAFLTLSDDGIRRSRLARFVVKYAEALGATAARVERIPSEAEAEASLERLCGELSNLVANILHPGIEAIQGLNRDVDRFGHQDVATRSESETKDDPHLYIADMGLRSRLFSDLVAEEILQEEHVGLMHWLIAEECLRQYTLSLRHAQWRDADSLLSERRLIQGLKHGFEALRHRVETDSIRNIKHRVLPSAKDEAFFRLYALFFRETLEAPPRWRLSRVLQADHVKRDLLFRARNALMATFEVNANPKESGPMLAARGDQTVSCDSIPRIVCELAVSSARSSFEAGFVREALMLSLEDDSEVPRSVGEGFGDELERWRKYLRAARVWNSDASTRRALMKVRIDALFYLSTPSAIERARHELTAWTKNTGDERPATRPQHMQPVMQLTIDALRAELEAEDKDPQTTRRWLKRLVETTRAPETAEEPMRTIAKRIAEWREHGLLASAADTVLRFAELKASPVLNRDERRAEEVRDLVEAYLLFQLSDSLRRVLFLHDPLTGSVRSSAFPTQLFVSICIELSVLKRRTGHEAPDGLDWADSQFFLREARRYIDILSRFSGDLPRERPSVLVLEARLIRQAREDLRHCLKLLSQADRYLVEGGPHVRARLGMLATRIQIALDALREARAKGQDGREYVEMIFFDYERFRLMMRALDSEVMAWSRTLEILKRCWQEASLPATTGRPQDPPTQASGATDDQAQRKPTRDPR